MSHRIIWDERAVDAAARFLKDDPDGLRQLFASVDLLADDPRPVGAAEYGSPDLRRMHVGRYRVVYEIVDSTVTIIVISAASADQDPVRHRIRGRVSARLTTDEVLGDIEAGRRRE
jgi:mRNA interferase RelE/StbE